jgi:hypothetical protein
VTYAPKTRVAALFVESGGVYTTLDNVDCWDIERDAMLYPGNWPVVAHPPCQLWGNFAKDNFKRYGGDHNRPGNDGGMFRFALERVLKYGGVLEHPASSNAWKEYGLQRPSSKGGWTAAVQYFTIDGRVEQKLYFVCEIWQSAYGHKARKKTWLLYSGERPPFELNWLQNPKLHTHQIGNDRTQKNPLPTLGKKEASRTPILFAKELVKLAKHSKGQ